MGFAEELEGDQGLQERCVPAAQGAGREGRALALAGTWSPAHNADEGAGRVHWRHGCGPLQAGHLPVLSSHFFYFLTQTAHQPCWLWLRYFATSLWQRRAG